MKALAKSVATQMLSYKITKADLFLNSLDVEQFCYFLRFWYLASYKFDHKED